MNTASKVLLSIAGLTGFAFTLLLLMALLGGGDAKVAGEIYVFFFGIPLLGTFFICLLAGLALRGKKPPAEDQ